MNESKQKAKELVENKNLKSNKMVYEARINSVWTVRSNEKRLKSRKIKFVFINGKMTCVHKTENMSYEYGVGAFFNGTYTTKYYECKVVELEEILSVKQEITKLT